MALKGKVLSLRAESARNQRVWELHTIDGYSQTEIAEVESISQQRVSQILGDWADRHSDDTPVAAQRRICVAKIETKMSQIEERMASGVPHALWIAYCSEWRKLAAERARLLGAYAPQRVDIETPGHVHYDINGVNPLEMR